MLVFVYFYCYICILYFYHRSQIKKLCDFNNPFISLIVKLFRRWQIATEKLYPTEYLVKSNFSLYPVLKRLTKLSTNDQRFNVNCSTTFFYYKQNYVFLKWIEKNWFNLNRNHISMQWVFRYLNFTNIIFQIIKVCTYKRNRNYYITIFSIIHCQPLSLHKTVIQKQCKESIN